MSAVPQPPQAHLSQSHVESSQPGRQDPMRMGTSRHSPARRILVLQQLILPLLKLPKRGLGKNLSNPLDSEVAMVAAKRAQGDSVSAYRAQYPAISASFRPRFGEAGGLGVRLVCKLLSHGGSAALDDNGLVLEAQMLSGAYSWRRQRLGISNRDSGYSSADIQAKIIGEY